MEPKYPLHPDSSGSMHTRRDFIVGDVHGGTDFTPALQAIAGTAWTNKKGKTMVIFVTDGYPSRRKKAKQAAINRYVQQLRHRGCGKMRSRRIPLKSFLRCYC